MTHKFQEEDTVVLKKEIVGFIPAGSHGKVFCLSTTLPLVYVINFPDSGGETIKAAMYEHELECCFDPNCTETHTGVSP